MNRIFSYVLAVVGAGPALLSPAMGNSGPGAVQITVYNQNFALVKESRQISLNEGVNTVAIDDVAARIQPQTVHFKSLTAPDAVRILEQNYQYDLLDPFSVLNKSVGKRIVVRNTENGDIVEGTVLNPISWAAGGPSPQGNARGVSPGSIVIQTSKGIVLNAMGQIELLELPDGLIARPRLQWMLHSDKGGVHNSEVSYLTEGITWSADYVAVVSADDNAIDLKGWVTISNNSGATYHNAKLQLVAGDVRRLSQQYPHEDKLEMAVMGRAAAEPQFQQEQFFDYHLYTLQRPSDVLDRETKQISLLEQAGVKATKKFYYDGLRGARWWRGSGYRPGDQYDTSDYKKVNVTIEFKNSEDAGLGMPLPKGTVRVYKKDSAGALQFVGEDTIDHTPKDENLKLYVGDAFDVVGERKRTKFTRLSDRMVEEDFEITLRNHQKQAIEVTVVERVFNDWEILSSSHKYTSNDSGTLNFVIPVPASGETKVTYKVRTKW